MSVMNLEKRLRALENDSSPVDECRRPFMGATNLLMMLVAVHLGGFNGREAIAEAYSRALGYEASRDFHNALSAGSDTAASDDLNRRYSEANRRLLALKDTPVDDGPRVRVALEALFDELPETAHRHPFIQDVGSPGEAMEWLCA